MDITDQVRKREKMAKLREEIAVQKAMETELNRMLHINDETMRAKQMLATMSHEIRSPLSGVISIAELLATTNLDPYQKHLISLMISSGEVVIQLINDILDLSRVESGVMKLEAIKFRPREVVKHVIQTAAASSKKTLMMEGRIAKEVPLEVVGDVMRIRQILTNLLSNAIKFTHEGMVGIKLQIVPEPSQNSTESPSCFDEKVFRGENRCSAAPAEGQTDCIEPIVPTEEEDLMDRDEEKHSQQHPSSMVWIRCDVYDTGIGIPEKALPTLFKQYTQVSADHARKYGGTGLGLSICKQLVELMGGYLHVTSKEQCGSTFTFVLPYRVSPICDDQSDDPDELPDPDTAEEQPTEVHFQLQPQTLASYFAVDGAHGSASPSTTVAYMEAPQLVFQPASSCPPESSSLEDTVNPPSKLEEGDCKMETSDRSMPTTSQEVTQSPKKPRILLVEDNKINVMVTKSMMNKLGHVIEVVNNGAEAVRAVQIQSYDLILMDVCMPVMDGLEATRIIREYENTGSWDAAGGAGIDPPMPSPHSAFNSQDCYASDRRIPIIAMTANALAESEEECIENGMDSVVTKPVTFPKLKACLDELFPGTTNPIP